MRFSGLARRTTKMRIGIKASAPPDSAPYTFRIKPVEHGQVVAPRM